MGIVIEDLAVAYGGQRVIDGLALTIEPGSFFTLLGPSGCGKTTLLRTIAGFVPAERGHMRFGGTEVTHLPPHKRDIGMCFQDYALFPDKTVFDNVAYGLRARKQAESAIKPKVQAALERVGLGHLGARHPAALSGGQRQRVALARAVYGDPSLIVLDEPNSNLDAIGEKGLAETLEALRDRGAIVILVTHRLNMLSYCDHVLVMNSGTVHAFGPRDHVVSRLSLGQPVRQIGQQKSAVGEAGSTAA